MPATANSWRVYRGPIRTMWFPKKASTAIAAGVLLEWEAGYVKEATTTAGATDTPLAGLYEGPAITSGSANYATTDEIPVIVPGGPHTEFEGAVDTGSLAATDPGKSFDISATNGVTVSTSANEAVTCAKYISATKGLFILTTMNSPAA